MAWHVLVIKDTLECIIIRMNLPEAIHILTVLNHSGATPKTKLVKLIGMDKKMFDFSL